MLVILSLPKLKTLTIVSALTDANLTDFTYKAYSPKESLAPNVLISVLPLTIVTVPSFII